ncbi:hypothetical protein TNCT_137391 [Trichonephila clavata]|uniref:Uncharacterized protein n=1 Tax=Trichonephila clavata TaxID=2740835 RepID=A0A8X6HR67_TRICU|nr:hypothetical protein TNCT_137391 [Trichonephila clavata]
MPLHDFSLKLSLSVADISLPKRIRGRKLMILPKKLGIKTREESPQGQSELALGVDERRQFVINWSGMSAYGSFKSIFRVVSHYTLECHPD